MCNNFKSKHLNNLSFNITQYNPMFFTFNMNS